MGLSAVRDMRGRQFNRRRPWGKPATIAGYCAALWLALTPVEVRAADPSLVCAELEAGPSRTVTRIIDGETLALDDGSELRLAGVLAPRALDVAAVPGTWRLELAAVEALQAMLLGRT